MKDEEVWFVAKDVCDVLNIKNSHDTLGRLDDDEKATSLLPTHFGYKEMNLNNESGLYNLIFTSRKEEAKKFKKWVTNEVLPDIRKHGVYTTDDALKKSLDDPDYMIGLLIQIKEEREMRLRAEAIDEKNQPLVTFAERCLATKETILVRELAKLAKLVTDESEIR